MFYVTIREYNSDHVKVEYWYNTDLRYEDTYLKSNIGSFSMSKSILEWLGNNK